MMSTRTKTVRYTATLPENFVDELKVLAEENKVPSVNFAIKEAVDLYLGQIKKAAYEEQMRMAGQDKNFLARTFECADDFKAIDGEVLGNW